MKRRAIELCLVAVAAAVLSSQASAARRAGLVRFVSCPALAAYASSHAESYVTANGIGTVSPGVSVSGGATSSGAASSGDVLAPTAAAASPTTQTVTPQQGVTYSGTNVQEAGVDEPDIVKTDGTTLFSIENNELEAVDVSTPQPKLLDTLPLTDGGWSHELLLSGAHLLVLSRGGDWLEPLPAEPAQIILPAEPGTSVLTEIDVSNPSNMRVVGSLTLDGSYLDARMIGSIVRVITSTPMPTFFPGPEPLVPGVAAGGASSSSSSSLALARNRATIAHEPASAWLPTYHKGSGGPTRTLVSCRNVFRPVIYSGLGMLTVLTIDLSQGLTPLDTTSIMTDGRIVYASPTTLFVATEGWVYRPLPRQPQVAPADAETLISAFDISNPAQTTYLGSGTVPGYLLDQWSMSEAGGVLRVVSTDTPAWWGEGPASQSYLTTLQPDGGALGQLGQLGGIGQGGRVEAVRMIGNTAYVATFNQNNPLITIDVSNPAAPQVLGLLDLSGTESYLQPIGSNLLLGVGEGIDPTTSAQTGTEVTLFDVSNPATPRAIATDALGQGWSSVESDSHAFLYWPPTGLVVVPFGQEAVAMKVSASGISELGRVVQADARTSTLPNIDRALVDNADLYTVSSAGVASNDLTTLADEGFAPFPLPPPAPVPVLPPTPVPVPGPIVPTPAGSSTTSAK